MKTAIVILNWNTKDFLGRFLPALTDSVKGVTGAEVIVADNASDDGSVEFLRNTFPDIRTVVFEKNLGFTGGYNRAFEEIVTKGGDDAPEYFLLLNSDIEVAEGWLEPLVDWMDNHPECGACAPKLHSWHRKEYFEYAGAAGGHIDIFGYPFCRGRIMSKVECDSGQYDNMHPDVFWVSGACLMVRSRTFSELGGLDERFFAHMEEIDLCWRIQLAGQKVCVVNGSKVYHVGGGTLPAVSPFKLFLNYRNNLLMLNNNLAYTYAIRHYRHGLSKVSAAEAGIRDAERTIRTRMLLDGLSATVYLLTFRFKYFKSVVKAHREYRNMKKPCDTGMVASFLRTRKDTEIRNIFGKWMVLQYLIHGRRTFAGIHETDFIKF